MMRQFAIALVLMLSACALASVLPDPSRMPGVMPVNAEFDARHIVERAHAAAGGQTWVRPRTLHLVGEGVFYSLNGVERHERYEMWRVYPERLGAAHAANGRVRIQSWRNGETAILLAFDGERSYTAAGPQPISEADQQWSENFGFGVLRYALDEGFSLARMPDDIVDGRSAYVVRVTDPQGQQTLFSMAHDDYSLLRVAFATPRGWHERTYSEFFRHPGSDWVQPGRVRLTYNGVKQNEIFWRAFTLNGEMPDSLFVIAAEPRQ